MSNSFLQRFIAEVEHRLLHLEDRFMAQIDDLKTNVSNLQAAYAELKAAHSAQADVLAAVKAQKATDDAAALVIDQELQIANSKLAALDAEIVADTPVPPAPPAA